MGKGSKRRPENRKAIEENWPWASPLERRYGIGIDPAGEDESTMVVCEKQEDGTIKVVHEESIQTKAPHTEKALEEAAVSSLPAQCSEGE